MRRLTRRDDLALISDEALILRLQRGAFSYLSITPMPITAWSRILRAKGHHAASPSLDLRCLVILSRSGTAGCRARTPPRPLKTLRFFSQSPAERCARCDRAIRDSTITFWTCGRARVWQCELSLIDTALLIAGMLTAACYFDGGGER